MNFGLPNVQWFFKNDDWTPFSERNSKKLEHFYQLALKGLSSEEVYLDNGRLVVHLKNRTMRAVYYEAIPTFGVLRGTWFHADNSFGEHAMPYSESAANSLENAFSKTFAEWEPDMQYASSVQVPVAENVRVDMKGPCAMTQDRGDFLGKATGMGNRVVFRGYPSVAIQAKLRAIRKSAEEVLFESPFSKMPSPVGVICSYGGKYRTAADAAISDDVSSDDFLSDPEISHLVIVVHGIGSVLSEATVLTMRIMPIHECTDLLRKHGISFLGAAASTYVEFLPIEWHSRLHGQKGVDDAMRNITLESIPMLREFVNDTVLDVLYYMSPQYHPVIVHEVTTAMNRLYHQFMSRNPNFEGGVSVLGHSLGSVISFDILAHQPEIHPNQTRPHTRLGDGFPKEKQTQDTYPVLDFVPKLFFAVGSPLGMFLSIRGQPVTRDYSLPNQTKFFNVFHPFDPVAYRVEPLIDDALRKVEPEVVPHHQGGKRLNYQIRDFSKSIRGINNMVANLFTKASTEAGKEASGMPSTSASTGGETEEPPTYGLLCAGRRLDYALQETPAESLNEYVSALNAHVMYWDSQDLCEFVIREALNGVIPGKDVGSKEPEKNAEGPSRRGSGKSQA